jgi:hypothetical protein
MPKYDTKDISQITNSKELDKRVFFTMFNYVLGGLLLYEQMYSCIKRIFSHTRSYPPKYELLPETMDDIYKLFFEVIYPFGICNKFYFISHIFRFPNQSADPIEEAWKNWVAYFIALLFLRQYSLNSFFFNIEPVAFPQIPKTRREISIWIIGSEYLKKLVTDHLKNENLLKELNFSFITKEWCIENKKIYPTDFIDHYKTKLQESYSVQTQYLSILEEKKSQFEQSTKRIIENTFSIYQLFNNEHINESADIRMVQGLEGIMKKDVFSQKTEVDHINYDTVLASELSEKIEKELHASFLLKRSKIYLLKSEEIFKAINKLRIDAQYLIICFGVDIDFFVNKLKISKLKKGSYQNISIINHSGSKLLSSSFFILKKEDLPKLSTLKIDETIISKFSLEKQSEILELYTAIIDFNNSPKETFYDFYNQSYTNEEELKQSLLLKIVMDTEIKWKRNMEMVHIIQYSEYEQEGILNELREVKPLK